MTPETADIIIPPPLVSVIIAVKNCQKNIQRCIDSFSNQTLAAKELIIIDGGSTDNTVGILKQNSSIIAHWESKPDRGIAHAWNKSLEHTRGEWILFLGADDYFFVPHVLEQFSNAIKNEQAIANRIIYGKVNLIMPNGKELGFRGEDWSNIKQIFFQEKMMIPHQACFHHKSVFKDYGFYDESLTIVSDYEFLLRVLKNEPPLFLPDLVVANMIFGGVSLRVSTLLTMQLECDESLRKNGFTPKGYKRAGNLLVYRVINIISKIAGERTAGFLLDIIRTFIGKEKVWTLK